MYEIIEAVAAVLSVCGRRRVAIIEIFLYSTQTSKKCSRYIPHGNASKCFEVDVDVDVN